MPPPSESKSVEILPMEDDGSALVAVERQDGTVSTFHLSPEEWVRLQRACREDR